MPSDLDFFRTTCKELAMSFLYISVKTVILNGRGSSGRTIACT